MGTLSYGYPPTTALSTIERSHTCRSSSSTNSASARRSASHASAAASRRLYGFHPASRCSSRSLNQPAFQLIGLGCSRSSEARGPFKDCAS